MLDRELMLRAENLRLRESAKQAGSHKPCVEDVVAKIGDTYHMLQIESASGGRIVVSIHPGTAKRALWYAEGKEE
jgi:hypothetical protein